MIVNGSLILLAVGAWLAYRLGCWVHDRREEVIKAEARAVVAAMTERDAYAAYLAGKITRAEWSRIVLPDTTDRENGSER